MLFHHPQSSRSQRALFPAVPACLALFLLFLVLGAERPTAARAAAPGDTIWIEGEAVTSILPADFKPNISGWGHPEYLSGEKLLQVNIDADKVDKQVPADGILLSYQFNAPKEASYEIWNRVGFELIRSPFDWRMDNDAWSTIKPDQDTVDVEELVAWNPIAWLKMGTAQLTAGAHTLQIRLLPGKDDKGKTDKLLYASDALVISASPFHPSGSHKPGDTTWQTAADRAAADQVFQPRAPANAAQASFSLQGLWQIAPDDELVVEDRTGPIKALPDQDALTWQAISIPGDRNSSLPEMTYVHRYWLRTRVNIPAAMAGHSLYLHFPSMNLLGTVFVNGQSVGFENTPFAAFDCDVTRVIKPGQVNDIVVGMKDPFYALADERDARHLEYIPYEFWHYNTTNQLDFPILSHYQTGILVEPTLVMAGKVYTSDIFAMPSVKNKQLGLEITVNNPTTTAETVQVQSQVTPLGGGPVEKSFAEKSLEIPAGQQATLTTTESWANPKLWWPDDPRQYLVTTRLSANGRVLDERTAKFGFREWDWHGPTFTLNGIPWHGRADLFDYGEANEAAVKAWKAHGQNMERLWGVISWGGMPIEQALDFYDSHGVNIRRTGIFDGEGAAGFYNLTEQVEQDGKRVTVARQALFDNWRRQLAAWVRAQRNHPSIFIWSMENEITFINSSVFGNNPYTDPEMKKAADMLAKIDPTRPQMVDGGNALLDQSLPVYGGHYMEPPIPTLPEGAYDKAAMAHRQKWPITEVKPILFGEAYYASGTKLGELATIGGEATFVGKTESYPAVGLIARMFSEGYRWNQISFHFWFGGETTAHYIAWQPTAVLCRQWNWSFSSGEKVPRTLGIFNDTRFADPIRLTWTLEVHGKPVLTRSGDFHVAPGSMQKVEMTLPLPVVKARTEADWVLALTRGGKQVFKDVKPISIFPSIPTGSEENHLAAARSGGLKPGQFLVYDPAGTASTFLHARGIAFTPLTNLSALPSTGKLLLIGQDALSPAESTSSALAAYASYGRTVVLLEQKNPLKYQGLPGEMPASDDQGYVGFPEDPDSPVLSGLEAKDFFTWGADGLLYRDAYTKPTSGGKSLVECGDGLADTALAEMHPGKGLLLISQLIVGEKLGDCAPAEKLFMNMLQYGASYRQVFAPVEVAASANEPLVRALDKTGLQYTPSSDPLDAIRKPGHIAIINATPANLAKLAANIPLINTFTRGGGWIIFNNLDPDGLASYNKIVGFDHMIRRYRQEKVTWPITRSPLTAGLATSNIVIGSGKRILGFTAGDYPDTDAFSYVVDYDDVAPFGTSTFWAWDNITNNYTQADGFWPLIINFKAPDPGKSFDVPITLPKPQTLTQLTWVSDLNYAGTTKIGLAFPQGPQLDFPTVPDGNPQSFPIVPPRTTSSLTLKILDWQHIPAKQQDGHDLVGIDNIYLKAARPPGFYQKVKPMLNIGAMMEYPRGAGGLVLCNVKFKDTEVVPENAVKKQNIISAILRNLKAPFTGGKTVIAGGANLTYEPIDISKQANQFTGDQGWFGARGFSFAELPTGKHVLAGVPYSIYDFTTSIVPTVIMLGGKGIPGKLPDQVTGIPINRKADALFFLQAARIDRPRSPDDIRRKRRFEMADYVIHYADGQTARVPIYSQESVENYKQTGAAAAIPGAQIAWSAPYPGTDQVSAAYSMQWTNPRPDVPIQSVDLVYGPDRRGVPALLAITAATSH